MAGTGDDDELGEADQVLPAVPGGDFGEGVGPDDEVRLLAKLAHAFDGVDGIAFAFSGLKPRCEKARIGVAGQLGHVER